MGNVTLDGLIRALSNHNVRAGRAYPANEVTRVVSPVVAVSLDAADQEKHTVTVLAEILGPQETGGSACQELAVQVCGILKREGALCRMGSCKFIGKGNIFRVPVWAVFQEGPEYTVTAGAFSLSNLCSFEAWQEVKETVLELSVAPWYFRVEEFFPWGEMDTLEIQEPFSLQLRHSGGTEVFEDCSWLKRTRTAEAAGIRQVREGRASARVITGI